MEVVVVIVVVVDGSESCWLMGEGSRRGREERSIRLDPERQLALCSNVKLKLGCVSTSPRNPGTVQL
jgi:hypothetical protein